MEIDFCCHPNFCGQDTSPRYSAGKYLDLAPRGAASLARPGTAHGLFCLRVSHYATMAQGRPRKRCTLHGALPRIPYLNARRLNMIRDKLLV